MVGQSPEQDEAAEAVQETIVSSSLQSSGDHSQDLSIPVQDTMTSVIQPVTGDRGNPYYSQQLDATDADTMVSTTQPVTGDRGNPYFSQALNVATQDAQITSTQFQPLEEDRNPHFSQLLASDNADAEDLSEDYDEDDSTDEEDEDEQVEFEKRVTLFCREDSEWKKLDLGTLRVLYDDDLNANKLIVISDKGDKLCNHVICMEYTIDLDEKEKSCEWVVYDFATDEPVPRHFKAHFSSRQAAEEFATIFRQGQRLAAESEISSNIPEEIEVPEVFSTEDRPQGAAAPET